MRAKSLQLCLTLCDPMDCSPLGSSVHGILQARIPEWAAMRSSRGSSDSGIEPASLVAPALAGALHHWRHLGSQRCSLADSSYFSTVTVPSLDLRWFSLCWFVSHIWLPWSPKSLPVVAFLTL